MPAVIVNAGNRFRTPPPAAAGVNLATAPGVVAPGNGTGTGNGQRESIFPRFSPVERAATRPEILLNLAPHVRAALEQYLAESVPQLLAHHTTHVDDLQRIQAFLDNRNPDPPPRLGIANFNTTLMLEHRNAAANRLERAIFGRDTPVEIEPTGRKKGDTRLVGSLNRLSLFVKHAMANPHMLNAREVLSEVDCDMTDVGTGAWTVVLEPDQLANRPDRTGAQFEDDPRTRAGAPRREPSSAVTRAVRRGGVTWEFIPFRNLIYWDGYGVDFDRMPFCGYRTVKTWQDLITWAGQGFYYKDAVAAVQQSFTDYRIGLPFKPPHLREHSIGVLFIPWDVNGDYIAEALTVEFHLDALKILRVYWNQFDGYVPLSASQYGKPSRRLAFRGMGPCQMLMQMQAEANDLHNYTIESGKRGGAWMTVVRRDSGIDEEIGDDSDPFVPGDWFSTENVKEDVAVHQLGDPRAGQFLTVLEERLQQQAARLTGFTDPNFGDVGSAKRVPKGLGLPILQASMQSSDRAVIAKARAIERALYLTFVAWRKRVPETALLSVLEARDVETLINLVFRASDIEVRDDIAITVTAKDVTNTEDAKRQSLLLLIQFLTSYYERVATLIASAVPQATQLAQVAGPEAGQAVLNILMQLLTRLQAAVSALVRITEELGDPEDVLLELDEIQRDLATLFSATGRAAAGAGPGQGQGQAGAGAGAGAGGNVLSNVVQREIPGSGGISDLGAAVA